MMRCPYAHHAQFEAIKTYISGGGCVLVLLGEGGESKYETNVNFLLEEYGIVVNNGARMHVPPRPLTPGRRGGPRRVL